MTPAPPPKKTLVLHIAVPELKERVKMALAEAGYPDAEVLSAKGGASKVPAWEWWQACERAESPRHVCWPCYQRNTWIQTNRLPCHNRLGIERGPRFSPDGWTPCHEERER